MSWVRRYWLETLFGLICGGLAAGYRCLLRRARGREAESAALKQGVMAILHDRLYAECTVLIRRGRVRVAELRNVEYLYSAYHALGGNGTGTELYTRVKQLNLCECEEERYELQKSVD